MDKQEEFPYNEPETTYKPMGELDNGRLRVCADTQTLSPDPGNAGVGIWMVMDISVWLNQRLPIRGRFFVTCSWSIC